MSERWGDSRQDRANLDAHIEREQPDLGLGDTVDLEMLQEAAAILERASARLERERTAAQGHHASHLLVAALAEVQPEVDRALQLVRNAYECSP